MTSPAMGLWKILCFLIFLEKSWGQEQKYVISAPKVFYVGASKNITIRAYGYTEAFDVAVFIKSYPDKNFNYTLDFVHLSPENKFQNSSILTIQPRQVSGGQSPASRVYLEVISKHFSVSEQVTLACDNRSLFIHTDKATYTPDQSVKVRVYSVYDDLQPVRRETVLTFIDPEGSEVDITGENDHNGIVSFPDFKIPPDPRYGMWTVKAKYKEDASAAGTTYFEIKENDKTYKKILSPSTVLEQKIEEQAAKYKHPVPKKCCYDGASLNTYETCEERVARVKVGPLCVRAFRECCTVADSIRTHKSIRLSSPPDSSFRM